MKSERKPQSNKPFPLIIVAIGLACSSSIFAAEFFQVTEIGSPYVYAKGLNESRQVVGFVKPNDSWSEAYAFLWHPDTGLSSLGGYAAYDINESGQVAGKVGRLQAAVWQQGAWIVLEDRQGASAINDHGQVTGLISAQPSIPGPYAPYRDDDIHLPGFITLPRPYSRASHGKDINNHGQIVADCRTGLPGTLYVGLFYDAGGSYTILDNGLNYDAHSIAINDLGQIVGYTEIENNADFYAVYWDSPVSEMEYMGSLGGDDGFAQAINNAGYAVGISGDRAFLWSSLTGMHNLNDSVNPALGITLTRATDIADNGSIIAWGVNSFGQVGSYLLVPPWMDIDIRPASLIFNSRGLLSVAVFGSKNFAVTAIDITSIRLAGISPVQARYQDSDLILKFKISELVGVLVQTRDRIFPGDILDLTLIAMLPNGTLIRGIDWILVRGNVSKMYQ